LKVAFDFLTGNSASGENDGARRTIFAVAIGFGLAVTWASFAKLDEVTRGEGTVIPSSKMQIINAAQPGTISEILVRSGQTVRAGELLVRMDDTESSSQLGEIAAETQSLEARSQRLSQEGQGGTFTCPADLTGTALAACREEAQVQQARRNALNSRINMAQAAVARQQAERQRAQATESSLVTRIGSARERVSMMRAAGEAVPRLDLLNAESEVTDLEGQLAETRANIIAIDAQIRQAQAEAANARLEFQEEALDQRNQVNAQLAVNVESLRGAEGRLDRNELRAPMDGIVNNVQVTTIGGFVNAGEKIMEVVPIGEKLLVEARVRPSDIAFIQVGDPATVKVTAYDFSIYGGLSGEVVQVSADSIYDEVEKEAYFTVIIETDDSFLKSGATELPITPGMICTVDIITGRKTVMDYLLKPVRKAQSEALRER
jgi:adhesin transport system membrane fusion protein